MVLFIKYVVLTFESVDEILWCYHSNETSSAVLSLGTNCSCNSGNCFSSISQKSVKIGNFGVFNWAISGAKSKFDRCYTDNNRNQHQS